MTRPNRPVSYDRVSGTRSAFASWRGWAGKSVVGRCTATLVLVAVGKTLMDPARKKVWGIGVHWCTATVAVAVDETLRFGVLTCPQASLAGARGLIEEWGEGRQLGPGSRGGG